MGTKKEILWTGLFQISHVVLEALEQFDRRLDLFLEATPVVGGFLDAHRVAHIDCQCLQVAFAGILLAPQVGDDDVSYVVRCEPFAAQTI